MEGYENWQTKDPHDPRFNGLKRLRRKQKQEEFGCVVVDGVPIENVLGFTYVGTNLEADGGGRGSI